MNSETNDASGWCLWILGFLRSYELLLENKLIKYLTKVILTKLGVCMSYLKSIILIIFESIRMNVKFAFIFKSACPYLSYSRLYKVACFFKRHVNAEASSLAVLMVRWKQVSKLPSWKLSAEKQVERKDCYMWDAY